MIILGAWYAFHTLAETEWRHNYVAIATGGSERGGVVTSQVWNLSDKFKDPSYYGYKVVMSLPLCKGMKCIPCS